MPIYAYRCETCGFAKDVLQKMSDPLLTECPSCGKSTFKKQVTAAGFQLKGSGWYVTDFRGGNSGKSAPAVSGDGDAKPASAPATPAESGGSTTPAPNTPAAGSSAAAPATGTAGKSDKSGSSGGNTPSSS